MTVEAERVIKPGDDLRVGDRVELVAEIVSIDGGLGYPICLNFGDGAFRWFSADFVLAGRRVERALAVGDRVTWGASPHRGTIHAIVGDRAACTWDGLSSDANGWPLLKDLERSPAGPKDKT